MKVNLTYQSSAVYFLESVKTLEDLEQEHLMNHLNEIKSDFIHSDKASEEIIEMFTKVTHQIKLMKEH